MKQPMVRLCGLWKNVDKDQQEYFSGNYTYGTKLLVFRNGFKKSEKDPEYIVYLASAEKKENAEKESVDLEKDLPF